MRGAWRSSPQDEVVWGVFYMGFLVQKNPSPIFSGWVTIPRHVCTMWLISLSKSLTMVYWTMAGPLTSAEPIRFSCPAIHNWDLETNIYLVFLCTWNRKMRAWENLGWLVFTTRTGGAETLWSMFFRQREVLKHILRKKETKERESVPGLLVSVYSSFSSWAVFQILTSMRYSRFW